MKKITFLLMLLLTAFSMNAQTTFVTYAGTQGGNSSSYFGYRAGQTSNGGDNTCVGYKSGYYIKGGEDNVYIGDRTGFQNEGDENTFIGHSAGYKSSGSGNVFVGHEVGSYKTLSNKLYIDNRSSSSPLIEGDFDTDALTFNGTVGVGEDIPTGITIPDDIKLYVRGRFAQEVSGTIGSFGSGDKWTSIGTAFAPPGVPIPAIYGIISQGYGATLISGSKNSSKNLIGFSGDRLDFNVIDANGNGSTETVMSILQNGDVGIGTTSPDSKLEVAGAIEASIDYMNSDKRYKENIKTIDSALDKINAINGVSYGFKRKTVNDIDFSKLKQGNHLGFIAQDLEKVFPELVRKDEAGYYAVNYDGLIPVLVEGMKEQQEIITEQEQEMDDMKARLAKLEALLLNNSNDIDDTGLNIQQNADFSDIVLKQNAPNPFSNETTIAYELPENLTTAQLVIYDLNGRIISTYNVAGKGNVRFDANQLSNGTYIYALVADGKSIATQKMVIQK